MRTMDRRGMRVHTEVKGKPRTTPCCLQEKKKQNKSELIIIKLLNCRNEKNKIKRIPRMPKA